MAEPDTDTIYRAQLLGRFRLEGAGAENLTPRSRKARALLAYLLLARTVVSRDRLTALFWGDRGEEQARASLRQALYEMRELTSGDSALLAVSREHVTVRSDLATDLQEIEEAARQGDMAALAERVDQSDGELLADLNGVSQDFDEWLLAERPRIRDRIISRVAEASHAAIERGEAPIVQRIADALERIDPLDENVVRLGLRADKAVSDTVAGHRRYRRIAERLSSELGAAPASETTALFNALSAASPEERSPGRAPEALAAPRSRTARILIVLAALAGFAGLFWWFANPVPARPFVAVMPFQEAPGQGTNYFATGVSEEITGLLSRTSELRILGSTSSRLFRAADPLEAAQRLGVTHILEGSVRPQGNRIVVLARLVQASDGTQIWSDRYERSQGDIFTVQNEISAAVTQQLQVSRKADPSAGITTTPEVYDRYLAARSLARDRRLPGIFEARRLLQEAIAIDPRYAPAYASLAQITMLLANHPGSYGTTPFGAAQAEARSYAQKAIGLAPQLGEGYAAMGLISISDRKSVPLYERAVALDPQRSDFHRWLGQSYLANGRYRDALGAHRRAAALEPLWWLSMEHLIAQLSIMGLDAEARRVAQNFQRISIDPYGRLRVELALATGEGRMADSLRLTERLMRLAPAERRSGIDVAEIWAALGENKRALDALPPEEQIGKRALAGDPIALARDAEARAPTFWATVSGWWSTDELLVASGQGAALIRLYDREYRDPAAYLADHPAVDRSATTALIVALRDAGREKEAVTLIRGTLRQMRTNERNGLSPRTLERERAALLALAGNREGAIAALDRASKDHWFSLVPLPYRPLRDIPAFRSLASDPRLVAIEHRVLARVNQEREKLGLQPR